MNKSAIQMRIKEAFNLASDADLARFLGVSPATLSNWKSRGSIDYDLVFTKCENISLDWLLLGRGPMIRADQPAFVAPPPPAMVAPPLINQHDPNDVHRIAELEKDNKFLERLVGAQDRDINHLEKSLEDKDKVLEDFRKSAEGKDKYISLLECRLTNNGSEPTLSEDLDPARSAMESSYIAPGKKSISTSRG